MTKNEFYELNSCYYEFKLYNGITKYGYIKEDHKTNKYFIAHKSQKDFEVKLNQIIAYSVAQPKKLNVNRVTLPNSGKSRKAIILGAGASYDFTYEAKTPEDYRMPLTKSLFHDRYDEVMKKYPGAYDLSSEILLANDIENYFQEQWGKINRNYDQALLTKLINTQYYIHDLFHSLSLKLANNKKNNYLNLIKLAHEYTIENENEYFPIISFNYDTLIEEAITRHLQLQFRNMTDYVDHAHRKLLLFKPHGSANWIKNFNSKFMDIGFSPGINNIYVVSDEIYNRNYHLSKIYDHLYDEINVLPNPNNVKPDKNTIKYYYFPWLLLPYKDKDDLIMPHEHYRLLGHFLPYVDEVLVIGWKGTEDNFKKLLSGKLKDKKIKITLIEIDQQAAENFTKEYSKILPNSEITHIKDGTSNKGISFSQYIKYCQNNDRHFFTRQIT